MRCRLLDQVALAKALRAAVHSDTPDKDLLATLRSAQRGLVEALDGMDEMGPLRWERTTVCMIDPARMAAYAAASGAAQPARCSVEAKHAAAESYAAAVDAAFTESYEA